MRRLRHTGQPERPVVGRLFAGCVIGSVIRGGLYRCLRRGVHCHFHPRVQSRPISWVRESLARILNGGQTRSVRQAVSRALGHHVVHLGQSFPPRGRPLLIPTLGDQEGVQPHRGKKRRDGGWENST